MGRPWHSFTRSGDHLLVREIAWAPSSGNQIYLYEDGRNPGGFPCQYNPLLSPICDKITITGGSPPHPRGGIIAEISGVTELKTLIDKGTFLFRTIREPRRHCWRHCWLRLYGPSYNLSLVPIYPHNVSITLSICRAIRVVAKP